MSQPPPIRLACHADRRGISTVAVVAAVVVVVVACLLAVMLTADRNPPPMDLEAAQARVEELGQMLTQAIENNRDTSALLETSSRLVRELPDFAPAHVVHGQLLMHNGQLEPAAAALRESLRLSPDNAQAHSLLGSVFIKLNDLPAARSNFDLAISLNKTNPEYRVKLADALVKQGDDAAAEAAALDALRLNSEYHPAYALLSQVYENRQQLDMAQQQMAKAIAALPGEQEATRVQYVRRRAAMLRRANRPEEALDVLNALPREQLYTMEVGEDLARTYGMLSQPLAMGLFYDTLSGMEPTNPEPAALAAAWYLWAGEVELARGMVAELQRISPRHPELPELLKQLRP